MIHRERHTSEEAPARQDSRTPPASSSASAPSSATSQTSLGDGSVWTDWYHRASPAQQQEVLLRAIHQGVVFAHHLPVPAHATPPVRPLLSSLLNGQVKELGSLQPPALEYHDGELDRTQREAVARAVSTPDVCLIQGFPRTGKSRLIAEILVQAARRGERVLFLAPTTAALDSVLERLSDHPAICPIRYLAADESPAHLPPAVARSTLPERVRSYRETTLPAARAARAAAVQALTARAREQAHWPRLETLAEQHEQHVERLRALDERRDNVAAEVERLEPSVVFGERWRVCEKSRAEAVEGLDSQLAGLQAELDTIVGKQAQLESEWETIRPLAEARRGRRLWTGAWWRALLRSGLREQAHDLEGRRAELQAARLRLEQDLAIRQSERLAIENRYAAECRCLQDEEIARRRAELEEEIAAATRARETVRQQWQALRALLPGEATATDISRQAVAADRAAWDQQREQDARRAAAAEQWLQTVEQGIHTLPEKLVGCANVIAATTSALPGGLDNGASHFPQVFDLLILEQTHQVTEPEFAAAARRARRWALIGEPGGDGDRRAAGSTLGRPTPLPTTLGPRHFFQRLWQHLHVDPYRLPFAWMRRDDRLLCRLRPLAGGQEKWIETEPVVDRPDIELRILSLPQQAPRIVEVVFPLCMDIGEAKQFIFHELEELAVQTCGRCLSWSETAEAVVLEFGRGVDSETRTIALETGVCERVARLSADDVAAANGALDWHTCSLEFARAAGWTHQRAEEWVAERLRLRSCGRTVLLTAAYCLLPQPASCPTYPKTTTTEYTENTEKRPKRTQKKS